MPKHISFNQKVLKTVSKIPSGFTLTYKQVAQISGSPSAWRAVGNVLNKNYDSNIPCHRVVRSDGKCGGYNRGEGLKRFLLTVEKYGLGPAPK